jgi:transcriptional regulator GlxA family with amidase domain
MVYRPDRPTGFTGWRTPAPLLGLKIPRRVLEHELERLLSARHRFRDELDAPAAAAGPAAVRRARAFIDANADRPLTVADVADEAGVGVRALQQAFRRALGMSPTEYLRQVRLRAAHRDLLDADPAATTVADVAARWGWLHAGRFAARYRARYGVAPAATLRRGR